MSKENALKVLGLEKNKTKEGMYKKIHDFDEEEIQEAFQKKCGDLSEYILNRFYTLHFLMLQLERVKCRS